MKIKTFIKSLTLVAAMSSANANAGLIHDWQLNGNVNDTQGGNDAILLDNSGLTGDGYNFTASNGLSVDLTGLTDTETYTIEMALSLTGYQSSVANSRGRFSGYQKLIDFKDLQADEGFYAYTDYFYFYDVSPELDDLTFNIDEMMTMTVTRDGATDEVSAYLNGSLLWRFEDLNNDAIVDSANNRLHFFQDDITTQAEDAEGFVDYIRVYDDVRAPVSVP